MMDKDKTDFKICNAGCTHSNFDNSYAVKFTLQFVMDEKALSTMD